MVVRGGTIDRHAENYHHLYNDIAAAYADCLDWKVSGDTAKADKAVQISTRGHPVWLRLQAQVTSILPLESTVSDCQRW